MALRRIFGRKEARGWGKLRNEAVSISCSPTNNVKVLNLTTVRLGGMCMTHREMRNEFSSAIGKF
jgi:hypothetical protein